MKYKVITHVLLVCAALITGCNPQAPSETSTTSAKPPNILLILADDLGYGDISGLNPDSKISTPNIDALASAGMTFTDAHSNSSVCTPTRYGLLTGEYAWRSRLKKGVLLGYSPSLIPDSKPTLPSMLKKHGYYTACIGKWHLGVDWKLQDSTYLNFPPDKEVTQELVATSHHNIDFASPAKGGPKGIGFDYSFIIPASLDFEPYCYLENNTMVEPLDAETVGSDLDTGYTGAFWRPGKMSSSFDHQQVLPTFINRAVEFIASNEESAQPFFLYLPLNAPHTPWLPTDEFDGSTRAGTYGDFVKMVDDGVGKVLRQLEDSGLDDNTLVIFTSDNGAYWKNEFIEQYQHRSNFQFRGMKADIYEGGHRVPFIVRWPGQVEASSSNSQTICLTDVFATIQDVVKDSSPGARDSYSLMDQMAGEHSSNRPPVIHHSSRGMFAIRSGDWKLIEGLGSGGFTEPAVIEHEQGMPEGQLYNLNHDLDESENLFLQNQSIVDSLRRSFAEIREL